MLPGITPIQVDRSGTLPTRTASENGNVVRSTLPEFRNSIDPPSPANNDPVNARLNQAVTSKRILFIFLLPTGNNGTE